MVLRNIFFDVNSSDIRRESTVELERVVAFMQENENVRIRITGHTDATGGIEFNRKLSEDRAKAVYVYLIRSGVSETRLSFKGEGSSKPLAPNDSEDNKAKNRRIEFEVMK